MIIFDGKNTRHFATPEDVVKWLVANSHNPEMGLSEYMLGFAHRAYIDKNIDIRAHDCAAFVEDACAAGYFDCS